MTSPGLPLAPEFQVNTTTHGFQSSPTLARNAVGEYVIAWYSQNDTGLGDLYGQRYSAAGRRVGAEFRLNADDNGNELPVDVAMDNGGGFVAVWALNPNQGGSIRAQRFSAAGQRVGEEILVSAPAGGEHQTPSIAMDALGNFVVAWNASGVDSGGSGYDVYARRYDASGNPSGPVERVNTIVDGAQGSGAGKTIAMGPAGEYVITWSSDHRAVRARRYAADGSALGDEFLVDSSPLFAADADVGMGPGGSFVITWTGIDADNDGVYARRYGADGQPIGNRFGVNSTTAMQQHNASIAVDTDGDFVVTWDGDGQDGNSWGVFGQRYNAAGEPVGDEFQINQYSTGIQASAKLVGDADGDFLIAWTSEGQDGSYDGIFARRYAGPEDVDVEVLLTGPQDIVEPGAPLPLQIDVLNLHEPAVVEAVGTATGLVATLAFPAEAQIQSITGPNWSCNTPVGAQVACNYAAPLQADAVADRLAVTLRAPPSDGPVTTRVALRLNQFESVLTNSRDSAITRIAVADMVPALFDFGMRENVAPLSAVISDAIRITGINTRAPISIISGMYSINGGTWTTASGTIPPDALVRVRHGANTAGKSKTTTLTIGGVQGRFTSKSSQ